MNLKIIASAIFIVALAKQLNAQQTSAVIPDKRIKPGNFNLSFYTGISFLGPQSDMEANMLSSGYGDTSEAGWFGGAKDHPFTERYPNFDIEASYYYTATNGISVNGGLISNIEVDGFQAKEGLGNYLILKSELWQFSLCYSFRTRDAKQNFFIGPAYFIHVVKDNSSVSTPDPIKNKKVGIYMGYSYHIIQKKHWSLALKGSFKWAPDSEIGPYGVYKKTKVNLATLNFGLSIGLRTARKD